MVKITNEYGDKYTGKLGNAIYQKVHGQQVRRKSYKQTKDPSPSQLQVRTKFKEAIAWIKTLTSNQKTGLKSYYKTSRLGYDPAYPVNWYNFAKWLYIKNPYYELLNIYTNEYKIHHPGILKITEKDLQGTVMFTDDNLSSLEGGAFCTNYHKTANVFASFIELTLVTGQIFTYPITPPITSLIYCDILYCNPIYCK